MSFNIDEWKQRFSSCHDAETRCQMLKADGLVISHYIARDPGFVKWMLDNRLDDNGHSMALYCYKEQLSGDNEITRCFKFPIRKTVGQIKSIYKTKEKIESMGVAQVLPDLIKCYIQHYYLSCAQGPKYEPIQYTIEKKIDKLQRHICLLCDNKHFQQLQELYKDLRTKINMLVIKLVDEIITTDHWSCQLVIELVMHVI